MVLLREEDFQVNRRLQPDGAQTVEASLTGTDEAERRAQAEQTVLDQIPPAEPSESRAAYFAESTLHALIQRGAAVCLVTFPVSPDQVEISTNFPEVLATRRYIDTLTDTLDIRRVDYWAAVDDFSEFTNCDHLNAKGAARLASRAVPDCGFDQPKSSSSERSSQSLRHQAS